MGMFDQTTQENTDLESQATTTVEIDLDAEVEVEDSEADFNERTAPPKAGPVAVRWKLGEKGIVPQMDKNGKPYLAVYLSGELVTDPPFDGYKVNHYMNSIVFSTKPTSEVHHFMAGIGQPLPNKIKLSEMKEAIENALAQEPVGNIYGDWRASYQDGNDLRTNKPKYVEFKKSMEQFPMVDEVDSEGNKTGNKVRAFAVKSPKDGELVYAQYYVKQLLSQAEAKKLMKTATA